MNNTTIQISCTGGEVNAKTLQALGAVLFPAAETLEKELLERNALKHGDRLTWEVEAEGPDWDYTAQGDVTRTRGADQIGIHKVTFHTDHMRLGNNQRETLTGAALVKELASRLESQELLAL
jgi:hypothetical protein